MVKFQKPTREWLNIPAPKLWNSCAVLSRTPLWRSRNESGSFWGCFWAPTSSCRSRWLPESADIVVPGRDARADTSCRVAEWSQGHPGWQYAVVFLASSWVIAPFLFVGTAPRRCWPSVAKCGAAGWWHSWSWSVLRAQLAQASWFHSASWRWGLAVSPSSKVASWAASWLSACHPSPPVRCRGRRR